MRKRWLTRNEERESLCYARILQAEGVLLDIPDEWVDHSRPLDVAIAPPPISEVFERPGGGLSYAVYVRLLSRRRCMVEYAAMKVPWDDQIALESPDEKSPICQFGSLQFPLKKVLNLRIENTLKFARAGEVVEGVILATGLWHFPEGYTTGQSVPVELSLYDQYGEAIVEQGFLFVQRARRRARAVAPSEDLFGNPRVSIRVTEDPSDTTGSVQPGTFTRLAGDPGVLTGSRGGEVASRTDFAAGVSREQAPLSSRLREPPLQEVVKGGLVRRELNR
jgi:hypothetical protein